MTELKTEYQIATAADGCPTCRAFGQVGRWGDIDALLVNGIAFTHLSGVCQTCGEPFYWNSHLRLLAKITRSTPEKLDRRK